MIRRITSAVAAAFVVLVSQPALSREPTPSTFDAYVYPYVASNNFSGVVFVARNGTPIFERAYGFADGENHRPNTTSTAFHIASMSMQFTAAAILRLVDQGVLKLTTRVDEVVSDIPNGDKITVADLLGETSGLPDVNAMPEYSTILLQHQSATSLVDYIKGKKPLFEPGQPSNGEEHSAYNLLALIIEKKTHGPFTKAVRELVFSPLGMDGSGIDDDTPLSGDIAKGYAPKGTVDLELATAIRWSAKTGNGSAYSTVADELKWLNGVLDGSFLSAASRQIMFGYEKARMGSGWFKSVSKRFGVTIYYMNGRAPGFASFIVAIPSEHLSVVVLSNVYASVTTTIGFDLAAIALNRVYQPFHVAERLSDDTLNSFTGSFVFGSDFYQPSATLTLLAKNGEVLLHWPNGDTSPLIPTARDEFVDRAYWVPVILHRDDFGHIQDLVYDGHPGFPSKR